MVRLLSRCFLEDLFLLNPMLLISELYDQRFVRYDSLKSVGRGNARDEPKYRQVCRQTGDKSPNLAQKIVAKSNFSLAPTRIFGEFSVEPHVNSLRYRCNYRFLGRDKTRTWKCCHARNGNLIDAFEN